MSKLFPLVKGLASMKAGTDEVFKGVNNLKQVDLDLLRKHLEGIDVMYIRIKEIFSDSFSYNSYKIISEEAFERED